MRTTIEITDEQRAQLLELAARRGDKGFSSIVREAIDHYLDEEVSRLERVQRALAFRDAFTDSEGEAFEAAVLELRNRWDDEHR